MKFFLDTNIIIILSNISKYDNRDDKVREMLNGFNSVCLNMKQIEDILLLEKELAKYKQALEKGLPTKNQYCYNDIVLSEVMQGVSRHGIRLKEYLKTSGLTFSSAQGTYEKHMVKLLSQKFLEKIDNYDCFYEEQKYNSKNDAIIMADVIVQDGVVLTLDNHFINVNDEVIYRTHLVWNDVKEDENLRSKLPRKLDADRVASVYDYYRIIKKQQRLNKTDDKEYTK